MARIPSRLLEHTVILLGRRKVPTSNGQVYLPEVTTQAIVVDGDELVVDMREGSETLGQEIRANAHVLVQPEFYVPPGSLMTIWPGTAMERKLSIVRTAFGKHSIAWESAQFWGV